MLQKKLSKIFSPFFSPFLSPLTATFLAIIAICPAAFVILPKSGFSEIEKRALQLPPVLSAETIVDGTFTSGIESYLADHFPARLQFVGLHAYYSLFCGENGSGGVYRGSGGWLFNTPITADRGIFQQNLESISAFIKKTQLKASVMAIPTSAAVEKQKLPAAHAPYPDLQLLGEAEKKLSGTAAWVDIASLFSGAEDKESLYYRTDHHWTSAGAYLAYREFCRVGNISAVPAANFKTIACPGFYGTIYSKSGLWGTPPDTVSVWKDSALHLNVEIWDDGKPKPLTADSAFFMSQLVHPDKYPVFLDGNHSLVTIENKNVPDRRLLIVKDSYADCIAPFLAENYRETALVDLRYFRQQTVSDFAKSFKPDEVLFVYGLDSIVNDRNISLLD